MEPYADSLEHVLAELTRVDLLIRLAVRRAQRLSPDDRFRGLYVSDEEVQALAAESADLPRWARAMERSAVELQALDRLTTDLEERRAGSVRAGTKLRLVELERMFGMSRADQDIILICLASELDLRYERLFAYLQDDLTKRRPTVDLVLNLLADSFRAKLEARKRLEPGRPLIRHDIVEIADDPAHQGEAQVGRFIKLDPRILGFLSGSDDVDKSLRAYAHVAPMGDPARREGAVVGTLLERTAAEHTARGRLLVHLRGPRGVGKRRFASTVAARVGRRLLIVDGEALLVARGDVVEEVVRHACREAALQSAALYWTSFDALLVDRREPQRRLVLETLAQYGGLSFVAGAEALPPDDGECELVTIELPRPGYVEREQIWASALSPDVGAEVSAAIPALAARFRFTAGDIEGAVNAARTRARWRDPTTESPTLADIETSCRTQATPKLGVLAQKIESRHVWNDLVLAGDGASLLREICGQVRQRARVLGAWGFERKLSRGLGLAALFCGPSGTGKTMAAEILSGELGLDLYAIDLSSVVSKYIGETEKNLARIFAEAEASGAILFFDEADALFGKRTEVKDAHDRYANIETSYLLQRMEAFDGMSILATNLRRNIDEAFARRLAFVVQFALPEEPERLRIWQGVFPSETPLDKDVDFPFLAKTFKIAGGNIKNIALASAYLAAQDAGCVVRMAHLVQATQRELRKMGKNVTAGEFGQYADVLDHRSDSC